MKSSRYRASLSPSFVPAPVREWRHWAAAAFACALLGVAGLASGAPLVIEDFTSGVGRFDSPTDAITGTFGIFHETSSITHDPAEGHDAPGSLRVFVDDDPDSEPRVPWILRLFSGGGRPADNVPFESTGFVGFWLKTTSPELQAGVVVNDGGDAVSGRWRDVLPDGLWHLYEWDLDDPTPLGGEWRGGAPIDSPVVTVDSIFLRSVGQVGGDWDALFWIDDIGHNPDGSLVPEPSPLSLLALAGAFLVRRRRR